MTLKGCCLAAFQGRNMVRQQETLKVDVMLICIDMLVIPLTGEQIMNS